MKKCNHEEWIKFYPPKGSCWREKKIKKVGVSHSTNQIDTVVIRICMQCGEILDCKDYGE